jgi:hypothetical protein
MRTLDATELTMVSGGGGVGSDCLSAVNSASASVGAVAGAGILGLAGAALGGPVGARIGGRARGAAGAMVGGLVSAGYAASHAPSCKQISEDKDDAGNDKSE